MAEVNVKTRRCRFRAPLQARFRPFALLGLVLLAACGSDRGAPSAELEAAHHQNSLGVIAMDQHNYVSGRAHFEAATRLAPDYANGHANLGIALYSLGKYDSARVALKTALGHDPEHLHASYALGLIDHAQGHNFEAALAGFRRVLRHDDDDPLVHYYIGRTQAKLGHLDSAMAAYDRALALDPDQVSTLYALAQAQRQAGDRQAWRSTLETFNRLSQAGQEGVSAAYQGQGKYAEVVADGVYGRAGHDRSAAPVFVAGPPVAAIAEAHALALTDADGDGRPDVIAAGPQGWQLLRPGADGLVPSAAWRVPGLAAGAAPLSADVDDDGDLDLVGAGPAGAAVYTQGNDGLFHLHQRFTPCAGALFGDADHDGDADLLCHGDAVALWANAGDGTFTDITAAAGLTGGGAHALFTDYDADRDVDIVVGGAGGLRLFSNNRDGTFTDVAAARGLPATAAVRGLTGGDLDADGTVDLVRLGADGVYLHIGGAGGFTERALPIPAAATAVRPADVDNDGDLDLLYVAAAGLGAAVNTGDGFQLHDRLAPLTATSGTRPAAPLLVADIDGDGRLDVVGGDGWLRNTSDAGRHLSVSLAGLNSNPDGFGSRVEVVTSTSRQLRELRGSGDDAAALHFGLGEAESAQFVRILWPSGVRQTEPDTVAGPHLHVGEVNRKGTSCPILYAWTGERFEFVSDFLGGAIIGYLTAPGQYYTPDTDEYLRLPELAVDESGRYVLQIGNQLEEVIYLDAAELIAVDHPPGTEVQPNERLLSAPPYPEFRPYVLDAGRALPVTDANGRDVSSALAAVDDVWYDGFELARVHGYAEEWSLTLDLGELGNTTDLVLLAHGWVDYAHSTSNWAAAQANLRLTPPHLEARHDGGDWRTVTTDMGKPAGLPKSMLFDLAGAFPPQARRGQLRITTSTPIYWDQFRLARSVAQPAPVVNRRPFAAADLHWRGYPEHEAIHGTFAFRYDYDRVRTHAGWGSHAGAFTRYGEVTELVDAVDDRFVIMFHGDELTLAVDAGAFPPVADGWQRTWLFYADGFGKDMDYHSAHSLTVEPLPFHGMSRYPYGPDEAYPSTAAHMDYRFEYNTRKVEGFYR